MSVICGIYGFNITRRIKIAGVHIKPRTEDSSQARAWARDINAYHLTATIEGDSISREFLFYLEAILSFIEHLDVLISQPIEKISDVPVSQLENTITAHQRNNGGGAILVEDSSFRDSRKEFISKSLGKLEDQGFCEKTQFKILLFKYVETFRQQKQFVDISYFLLFSGLESYCRSITQNKKNENSSKHICDVLKKFEFNIKEENPHNLHRAVSTYTHLRNALFHNSELRKTVNINGGSVDLELCDYISQFSRLVSLVILKAVDFDDQHINWDSWIDRQPFK